MCFAKVIRTTRKGTRMCNTKLYSHFLLVISQISGLCRQSRHFPKRRLTTHPSHLRQDQRDNRRDKQTALPCLRRKVKETTPPIHVLLATKAQARARPSGRAADVTRSLLRMNIDIYIYIFVYLYTIIYSMIICNYTYIYVY